MAQFNDESDFQIAQAGSSFVTPSQWGALKKGGYAMLCGKPCKITEYSTAKTGKHGAAKATVVGIDIFTGKKYEDFGSTTSGCFVPNIQKEEFDVADLTQEGIVLMDENANLIHDVKMPKDEDEELYASIVKNFNHAIASGKTAIVTILYAMGNKRIVETKVR